MLPGAAMKRASTGEELRRRERAALNMRAAKGLPSRSCPSRVVALAQQCVLAQAAAQRA